MLICWDLPDWRTYEQALRLDISLVESVFRGLAKRHQASNQCEEQVELARITQTEIDELSFAKADVLVALETAGQYLQKRRRLRSLHTKLACVTNEKEVQDVTNFVRFRLKEHSISCTMVKSQLRHIYETEKARKEFEDQVLHFKQRAKDSSPWCVRNWKCITKSPSRYYGVHSIRSKPKTIKQLEAEQQAVTTVSSHFILTILSEVMVKLIPQCASRPGTTKTGRSRLNGDTSDDAKRTSPSSRSRLDAVLKSRAKSRSDRVEQNTSLRRLRMRLFAPDLSTTLASNPGFANLSAATSDANNDDVEDFTHLCELRQEILALAEANGDAQVAQSLLAHPIASSGFRRAVEQAKNLSVPAENAWEVVSIWRSVYRTRTVQALQNASGK